MKQFEKNEIKLSAKLQQALIYMTKHCEELMAYTKIGSVLIDNNGCEDDVLVGRMVQVVCDMADYCRKNGISDGNCGMRSLIDWIMSTEITGDPYTSARYTIVSKATSDEEDRSALLTTVLEPIFAPKQKKAV